MILPVLRETFHMLLLTSRSRFDHSILVRTDSAKRLKIFALSKIHIKTDEQIDQGICVRHHVR